MGKAGKWALVGAVAVGVFVIAEMVYPTEREESGCDTPRGAIRTAEDALRGSLFDPGDYDREVVTYNERAGTIEVNLLYRTTNGQGNQTVVVRPDCSTQWG